MASMANEFKAFLLRGNVVDLAVGIVVVKPVNVLMERRKTGVDVESETRPCSECLSEIPRQARKCAFCASPQHAASAL
jgi:large conductance mechanosensitive channel